MLANYTSLGIGNINATTQRARDFKKETAKVGINVKDIYWTLGHHDIVVIAEAPDDKTMTAMLLPLANSISACLK